MDLKNENILEQIIVRKPISIYKSKLFLKIEKISKRGLDIIGGLMGVISLIPITIGVFIAQKVYGDKGPIFFSQTRIGKDGKLFKMYKYRSMVINADEELEKYLAQNKEAREEYNKYKKLKSDPRITKVGKFLRKTSLDEFPQFINVLKGEMSLVGPRPYLPKEQEEMEDYFYFITSFKPGVTGFWQISGRNNVTFIDRMKMDMNYYYTHSLKKDIKIIFKTIKKVIVKDGAI